MKRKGLIAGFVIMSYLVMTCTAVMAHEQNHLSHGGHEVLKNEIVNVHMNLYYQLLAEKYAPDQVKVWKNARKDREKLLEKLKELHENGAILHGDTIAHDWLEEHSKIQQAFFKAVKENDENEIKNIIPTLFEHEIELNKIYKRSIDMAK